MKIVWKGINKQPYLHLLVGTYSGVDVPHLGAPLWACGHPSGRRNRRPSGAAKDLSPPGTSPIACPSRHRASSGPIAVRPLRERRLARLAGPDHSCRGVPASRSWPNAPPRTNGEVREFSARWRNGGGGCLWRAGHGVPLVHGRSAFWEGIGERMSGWDTCPVLLD